MLFKRCTPVALDNVMIPLRISAHLEETNVPSPESPQEIEQAILREWDALQRVPSYVDRLIEANRGLIESIAAQR